MASEPNNTSQGFEVRFGKWVIAARWPITIISLILTALAVSGNVFLETATSYRAFFEKDNPQFQALESLENIYGRNDSVVFLVVPEDRDFASEQSLAAVVWLTDRAWQTPYSTRVDSIANFQHTTAKGDDLFVRNLVDPQKLNSAQERSRIRETALAEPRLAGNLVARDGTVSAVGVTVQLSEENSLFEGSEVAKFAYSLAAEAEEKFPGIDLRLVGSIIINDTLSNATIDSQVTFLSVSLPIMALTLGILIRGVVGVMTTGLVIIFSVLAAIGIGGWAGLPFTPSTAPATTIVLMISIAGCVHLLVTLMQRLQAGDSKNTAIVESLRINLYPMFLASLTTALGFLSMNFSEVPPYRHLGMFVTFGVGVSFLLTVTFLPALLSLLPMRTPAARQEKHVVMAAIAEFVIRHRTHVLWSSTAVVLVLLAAIPRNELNDVLVYFFDESIELRQDVDFMDKHLSGNTVLEYSIVSSGPEGIVDPAFLADLSAFADWYRAQPETRHVMVISDTFRQLNKSMHGDDPAAYHLPARRDLAAQYLLLYELSLPLGLDLNNQINVSKSATRMTVTAKTLSSKEIVALNERATAWLNNNAPHFTRAESAGVALMFAHIGLRNIKAMLLGITLALIGISILLIIALRSIRLGLVSLVPNLVPSAMGFGVWALTVGEVGLILSVVMAMTIGIVVDDTVYFLSKYLKARRKYNSTTEDAVRYAFRRVGRALVTTSAVLVAGFLTLVLSPFVPNVQVGLLIAMIITFALIADFLLLPTLLMALDRRPRSTEPTPTTLGHSST